MEDGFVPLQIPYNMEAMLESWADDPGRVSLTLHSERGTGFRLPQFRSAVVRYCVQSDAMPFCASFKKGAPYQYSKLSN